MLKFCFLLSLLMLSLALSFCIKDKTFLPNQPTKLIFLAGAREKGWIQDSIFFLGIKSTNIKECNLDNQEVYTQDGALFEDVGETKCAFQNPQRYDRGTYSFNSDTTEISYYNYGSLQSIDRILKLDANNFVRENTQSDITIYMHH